MKSTAAALLLMLLRLSPIAAQSAWIDFAFAVDDYPTDRIIESLVAGHRSEVLFEIRVLKKVTGFRRILGDVLVHQEKVTYVARWDALNELFVIKIDDTQEIAFEREGPFLAFFLSLADYRINIGQEFPSEGYLLCRSRIQPIKLVPPLTLMTLIRTDLQTISAWTRVPVRVPARVPER